MLHGALPLRSMTRVHGGLASVEGEVLFSLRFSLQPSDVARIEGEVSAELQMLCQRCLEPARIPIRGEVRLELVEDVPGAATTDESFEPFTVGANTVSLAEMVEDELILAVPGFPTHPEGVCRFRAECDASCSAGGVAEEGGLTRPFAGLDRHLKGRPEGNR